MNALAIIAGPAIPHYSSDDAVVGTIVFFLLIAAVAIGMGISMWRHR